MTSFTPNMADSGFNEVGVAKISEEESLSWNDGQLTYIGHECEKIPEILGRLYGLQTRRLDLSFNQIRWLTGLETFTGLKELILDNNELMDNIQFPPMDSLQILSLNKNKLTNLELVLDKISSAYPNLHYLSLLGNEACPDQLSADDKDDDDYRRYRHYVLFKLTNLRFLDFKAVNKNELLEARRIGSYLKVVRPIARIDDCEDVNGAAGFFQARHAYSPLPNTSLVNGSHTAAYGICRYRYSGKHSEGNRFIRNNDL